MRALRGTRLHAALGLAIIASGAGMARRSRAEEPVPPQPEGPVSPPTTERPGTPPPPPKYTPYVDRGQSLPAPFYYGVIGFSGTSKAPVAPPVTPPLPVPVEHPERRPREMAPPAPENPGPTRQLETNLSFGVGLTKNVWLDGTAGSMRLYPERVFHSAGIGPNALILDTPILELDVTTHVSFAAEDGRPVEQIEPGIYGVLHIAHKLRIDAGIYVDANPGIPVSPPPEATAAEPLRRGKARRSRRTEGGTNTGPATTTNTGPTPTTAPEAVTTTVFGMRVPVNPGFQITQKIYGVVNTGVTIDDLNDARKTTYIPMGFSLGWSDQFGSKKRPWFLAVSPSISWPEMFRPGDTNVFRPDHATVSISFVYVSKY